MPKFGRNNQDPYTFLMHVFPHTLAREHKLLIHTCSSANETTKQLSLGPKLCHIYCISYDHNPPFGSFFYTLYETLPVFSCFSVCTHCLRALRSWIPRGPHGFCAAMFWRETRVLELTWGWFLFGCGVKTEDVCMLQLDLLVLIPAVWSTKRTIMRAE